MLDTALSSGHMHAEGILVADLTDRLVAEWPAVLAIAVLVLGHVVMMVGLEESLQPLGIPLFAAIIVFILGEFGRRLV